jgi:hypothetical protein
MYKILVRTSEVSGDLDIEGDSNRSIIELNKSCKLRVDWIQVAQGFVRLQALVDTVMSVRVP